MILTRRAIALISARRNYFLTIVGKIYKEYLETADNNKKLQREISILGMLKHKNIVRLYETISNDKFLLNSTGLCSGGDLVSYVRKRRKLTEPIAKIAFKQILDRLTYCHYKGVVHRDIKLDNILLDFYGNIKVMFAC